MLQLVIFINLFLVPLLPLYIIYKKREKQLIPNLDLLFQYGIVVVCNIPLTKAFVFSIHKIGGIYISIDSGYYTVAALLPTILLILLYIFYQNYLDHTPWVEKICQKGVKGVVRDLAPACVLLFTGCFMMFIFEPILMYASNINDFWFDFKIMIWPVLFVFSRFFLAGIVIICVIYNVDLWLSKRLLFYRSITLVCFIVFVLIYLQGNWLAGKLPLLDGETIVWENYGKHENLVLLAATLILAIAIIISIRKRGLNSTLIYTAAGTSVVFVMLFASLVSTVLSNRALASKDELTFNPTLRNYNTISSENNFLIFLTDSVNFKTFYNVMMGDDDFRGMMEDFTYYPDTLSATTRTGYSLPNILSGTLFIGNPFSMDYREYFTSSMNQSPLFEKLSQNGYGINLYSQAETQTIFWDGEKIYDIENTASIHDISVDLNVFMEQELKYIKYKYLPYGLKQFANIETLDFNECQVTHLEYAAYFWDNVSNYKLITENSVLDKRRKNYFQFVHIAGAHPPYTLDKDLNIVEGGTTEEEEVAACLTMIKAYLQRLKDNDAYDNSVIVIMSDHGQNDDIDFDTPEGQFARCNPILLIKGFNEKHEMLESDRPVSYMDLQEAFCDLIDGKQSTELFENLEPGRTRMWVTAYGVGRPGPDVIYNTTGKAWEFEKCIPTG